MMEYLAGSFQLLAEMIAKRVGRAADDVAVRTFAGALIGAVMVVYLGVNDHSTLDYVGLIHVTATHLETGRLL